MSRFLKELKRRNVFKEIIALLSQVGVFSQNNEKSKMYAKKSYELALPYGAKLYIMALINEGQFKVADTLLNQTEVSDKLLNEGLLSYVRAYYYYKIGEYTKCLEELQELPFRPSYRMETVSDFHMGLEFGSYAALNEKQKISKLMEEKTLYFHEKAIAFSILEQRDSMYLYLDKADKFYSAFINSFFTFDPYRNEDGFKSFQKKNFLSVLEE